MREDIYDKLLIDCQLSMTSILGAIRKLSEVTNVMDLNSYFKVRTNKKDFREALNAIEAVCKDCPYVFMYRIVFEADDRLLTDEWYVEYNGLRIGSRP